MQFPNNEMDLNEPDADIPLIVRRIRRKLPTGGGEEPSQNCGR